MTRLADLIAEWRRYAGDIEANLDAFSDAARPAAKEQAIIWSICANQLEKAAVEMTVIARLGKDNAFDLGVGYLRPVHPPTIADISVILEKARRELDKSSGQIKPWGSLVEPEDNEG